MERRLWPDTGGCNVSSVFFAKRSTIYKVLCRRNIRVVASETSYCEQRPPPEASKLKSKKIPTHQPRQIGKKDTLRIEVYIPMYRIVYVHNHESHLALSSREVFHPRNENECALSFIPNAKLSSQNHQIIFPK